jgi:hypothetical protein
LLRALAARKRRAAEALPAEELVEEAEALNQRADLAESQADEIQWGRSGAISVTPEK